MAEYGLGNFVYELTFDGKNANFAFRDPEDLTNTAEVSVSREDFPEGITQADSRQVADLAYLQVAKVLNDKRDNRLKKEAADSASAQKEKEAVERETANDYFDKTEELGDSEVTGDQPKPQEDKAAPAHTPTAREEAAKDSSKKNKKSSKEAK